MPVNITEKKEQLYLCNDCRTIFLFSEDVEDHVRETGHNDITASVFG